MKLSNPHLNERDQKRVREYPKSDPLERYEYIQKLCRIFELKDTKYVSDLMSTVYGYDRNLHLKIDFS